MKQVYPTFILNTNDGSEHPFLVCVPDMEIFTEGDSFADAIERMATAIPLALDGGLRQPKVAVCVILASWEHGNQKTGTSICYSIT